MKRYLLDTNICIYLFKKRHHILERMNQVGWENCYISEITLAEFYIMELLIVAKKNENE